MRGHRESGQAAVETAIVMPLFVFIMLGLVQLMLLYQGRMMVKYAAFKATRTGSINRVKMSAMENSALAVLMPFVTRLNGETLYKLDSGASYVVAYNLSRVNRYTSGLKMVEVTVCQPTNTAISDKVNFDHPYSATDNNGNFDFSAWSRTRLATQVTFNMPMVIPFVNGVLWYIMLGANQWMPAQKDMMMTLRLKNRKATPGESGTPDTLSGGQMRAAAMMGRYYAPIRGSWSMRMFSNALPGSLPDDNYCKVPYKAGVSDKSL